MADPRAAAARAQPERPWLRPWYRIVEDGERILLEYAHVAVILEGASVRTFLPTLLPLLDGTRTVEEVVAALGPPARDAVNQALALLAERGLLTEGPPVEPGTPADQRETAELISALAPPQVTPRRAAEALRTARVASVGHAHEGETAARLLLRAGVRDLAFLGWADAADTAGLDLVLAFPSPQELPQLDDWNRRMLERHTPWLQTLPFDGRMAAVGPLFVPGETCCHSCYQLRRAATSDYRSEFWTLARTPAAHPAPSALAAIAAGAAALLALRWLAWRDPLAPGKIQAIELGAGLELAVHHVYRVPRCPVCSGLSDLAPPLPWFKEEARVGG